MSFRRRQTLTPTLLAANRANARKSTGPRTAIGKRRVRFNALRDGRRARLFRETIAAKGEDMRIFDQIMEFFRLTIEPQTPRQERLVERLAQAYWCQARRIEESRKKLRFLFSDEQSRNVV